MNHQSGMIIGVLAFLLLGMGASTVYFVSGGATPVGRLEGIQSKLNEQSEKAQQMAATLAEKDSRLQQLERQIQLGAAKPALKPGTVTQNRMEIENKINALEAELSIAKTKLVKAENELQHVLEQFRDVEVTLKKKADDATKKAESVDQVIQAEKQKTAQAAAREAQSQEALVVAAREMESLRSELARLKGGVLPKVPVATPLKPPVPLANLTPPPNPLAQPKLPAIAPPSTTDNSLPIRPVSNNFAAATGSILRVDLKLGFIMCAMTSVEGVKVGNSLIVTRAGDYVGVVRVSKIDANHKVIIADLDALNLPKGVQQGDQVTFKK